MRRLMINPNCVAKLKFSIVYEYPDYNENSKFTMNYVLVSVNSEEINMLEKSNAYYLTLLLKGVGLKLLTKAGLVGLTDILTRSRRFSFFNSIIIYTSHLEEKKYISYRFSQFCDNLQR